MCPVATRWSNANGLSSMRPSCSDSSRFSSRLLRAGSTLRSARSMPSSSSTRPSMAARTGAWSTYTTLPARISRRCLRSASVVSLVMVTLSTSRPVSSPNHMASRRRVAPGGPRRNMSWPKASFWSIHRMCDSILWLDVKASNEYRRGTSSARGATGYESSTSPTRMRRSCTGTCAS